MTRTNSGWQPRRGRDDDGDNSYPGGGGPGRGTILGGVAVALAVILLVVGISLFKSIKFAQEGTVQVVTQWGRIEQVVKPDDGWFTTLMPGKESHAVTIRSFTEKAPVRVTSRDNAALKVDISVTAYTDPDKVAEYVRKYGFSEDERHRRRGEILQGLVQTEARNAFAEHGAYDVYASQEKIQQSIIERLRPQLMNQLHLITESVQIGNPDFLDDRIEAAASGVVANEKQKQAEQALLEAAKISSETRKIEALTYANPAMLEIKRLELQLKIEEARASGIRSHNGPLTVVYGEAPNVQMQVPLTAPQAGR